MSAQGFEQLTLFPEDSPASPFPWLESKREKKTIVTSGRRCSDGNKAMIAVWDGIDFICPTDFWEAWGEEITHWMPLPGAPEEGEKA